MVEDVRAVVIKLAERLCDLREQKNNDEETRVLAAKESASIYAPLANRLGIGQLKWELEDISFRYLHPQVYKKIAKYNQKKIDTLLQDAGIIRNKLKIKATITNAQQFLRIQKQHGSFDNYIWQFTHHKTLQNSWKSTKDIPAKTAESNAMSEALKKEGFKFVGSTICYAYMQAAGMVNDHTMFCFRYPQLNNKL